MLRYLTIPVTAFAQNCSIVWCDATQQAAVIDPGGDLPRIEAAVRELGVRLGQIWLTHAHIDHAGGTAELARRHPARELGGALTLGEIGSTENWGYPSFHNAAVVCTVWPGSAP